MPTSVEYEYKGYIVSATAERWAKNVWAGSYIVTVPKTGEKLREMPDTVLRKTFNLACTAAIAYGMKYIDRALFPMRTR